MSESEEVIDDFLKSRGLKKEKLDWEKDGRKKKCPECGGVNNEDKKECSSCGWRKN